MTGTLIRSTTKSIWLRNLGVAVGFLVLWLVVDLIDVKIARIPDVAYSLQIILIVVFSSFFWANQPLFPHFALTVRVLLNILISAVITFVWFWISVLIGIQFHLAIGGTL